MQIFNIFGRVVALGHTYFRVLCCCLSMFLASVLVRVLHPCVALALWKLLRTVGAVDGLWLLRAHGAGASHWQYGFALFCSSSNEGGKHLSGTLFLHLLVEITAWKEPPDYLMCLSHPRIAATFYVECPFTTFILKPVSVELYFWFSFGYRSGYHGLSFGAMAKKQKVHMLTY